MKVTLKDISRETGLSLSTVNHVLKERGCFREETKQRVRECAKKLGYRPNFFAQGVRNGRFNSAALVMSEKSDAVYLPKELLESIHDALADAHMVMTVTRLPDRELTDQDSIPKVLQQCMVDGLLIDYIASFPPGLIDLIRRYKVPLVWINSRQKVNAVHPDDFAAGQRAAQHLLKLGHRRIAFEQSMTGHYSQEDRRKGIAAALRQAGCALTTWSPLDAKLGGLPAFLGQQLSGSRRPTAVIAYDHDHATTLCVAAARLGLRLPQDLSVITFHDMPDPCLGITTLLIPVAEMGRVAVEMLLRRIEQPNVNLPPTVLPFAFAAGRTCGPPPTLT